MAKSQGSTKMADALDSFVKQFTDSTVTDVFKIGRNYFQASSDLRNLMQTIDKKTGMQAYAAGLYLGEEKGKKFTPSLALLDIIGPLTDKWTVIDEKAEWLFLCGRDVFKDAVVISNVKSGLVIVLNIQREVLGFGLVPDRMRDMAYVKNILDRGDYLRREMTKKNN